MVVMPHKIKHLVPFLQVCDLPRGSLDKLILEYLSNICYFFLFIELFQDYRMLKSTRAKNGGVRRGFIKVTKHKINLYFFLKELI